MKWHEWYVHLFLLCVSCGDLLPQYEIPSKMQQMQVQVQFKAKATAATTKQEIQRYV